MLFEQKSVMTAPHRATHSMIKLNINEVNKYSFLRYTLDMQNLEVRDAILLLTTQKKQDQKSRKSEQH